MRSPSNWVCPFHSIPESDATPAALSSVRSLAFRSVSGEISRVVFNDFPRGSACALVGKRRHRDLARDDDVDIVAARMPRSTSAERGQFQYWLGSTRLHNMPAAQQPQALRRQRRARTRWPRRNRAWRPAMADPGAGYIHFAVRRSKTAKLWSHVPVVRKRRRCSHVISQVEL